MNKYFTERQVCPICNSANNTTLLELGYTDSPIKEYLDSWYSYREIDIEYLEDSNYILNECNKCGLIYQKDILNEITMAKLYNHWIDYEKVIDRVDKQRPSSYYVRHAKDLINIILHFEKRPSELSLLDFGMGFGTWCYMAKGLGCDIYGTDISETRTDFAKEIKIISFKDVREYNFDFINAEQVFEHVADPFHTLNYLKQSLKPHGIIKIGVPNGYDIKRKLEMWDWATLKKNNGSMNHNEKLEIIKKIWDWEAPSGNGTEYSLNALAPLQHINCFNHDALVSIAEKAGLKQVKISGQIKKTGRAAAWKRLAGYGMSATESFYHALVKKKVRGKKSTKLFFALNGDQG